MTSLVRIRASFFLILGLILCVVPDTHADEDTLRAEELARQLRSIDHKTRFDALTELEALGPAALPAVDGLLVSLVADPAMARQAVRVFCYMHETPADAIPYLIALIGHPLGSSEPIDDVDKPAELQVLELDDFPICRALANAGAAAVEHIAPLLDSRESDVRLCATVTLGLIGRAASSSIPALRARLQDSEPNVRSAAVWSLAEVGGVNADAVAALTKLAADSDESLRLLAAIALCRADGQSTAAVELLLKFVKDGDGIPCETLCAVMAIRAIGSVGRGGASALPLLTRTMAKQSNAPELRVECAAAIAKIAPAIEREAMVRFLREQADQPEPLNWVFIDGDRPKREVAPLAAACALADLGESTVVTALIRHLMNFDAGVRFKAARGLANLGPNAAPAVVYLRRLSRYDSTPAVRAAARRALSQMERDPRPSP